MSGFSQSLDLGDQTFASLENQAGGSRRDSTPVGSRRPPPQLRRSTRRSSLQHVDDTPAKQPSPTNQAADESMEVIEESPTNSTRVGNETRQRSVRERLKTLATQSRSRKGLRRSKSDTVRAREGERVVKSKSLKSRSESRDQINLLMDHGCSELFRSDIRFDEGVEKVQEAGSKEVNISKLLESDFNFEIPQHSGRPSVSIESPQAKMSRKSDEFQDVFEDSDFANDPQPRSQSTMKLRPSNGSNYGDMFDQSVFTMDSNRTELTPGPGLEPVSEPEPAPTLPESNIEQDNSVLDEPLRVQEGDSTNDVDDDFQVENVTFTASLIPEALPEQQQHRSRFLLEELERSKLDVLESLQTQPTANTSLNSTLNQTVIQPRIEPLPEASPMTLDESKNLRQVSSWGLPEPITKAYARKGITELFQWQADCLANARVILECANLVYSAPTSGGKTIVSEFLVAKTVVERKRKALVILPFVAVAREKMYYLQEILSPAGIRVEGFFGGHTPPGGFDSVDVAVCTIEKANSIVNRQLEQQKLSSIGLVVVDEVHLISDPSRGYILELLLTKIRFVGEKSPDERIQIVAMSATLPNMGLLADWLRAEQFRTDFRPIELREMVKLGNCIFDAEKKLLRKLEVGEFGDVMRDQDQVAQLCLETILESCSVIVFCPSKDWCEKLTLHLAEFIYKSLKLENELGAKMRTQMDKAKLEQALARLKNCPVGLDPVLGKTAGYGCVYHHAGLTADERDIIESCFREGTLRVIVATSTLSSGVNLPARRVIIRTPMFGGAPMNALTYRQMIGRAGRKGRDVLGESILMCDGQNAKAGWELVRTELKPIASCLDGDGHSHLKRAILEIIASGVATTTADLERFVNCTLFSCEKQRPFHFDIQSLDQGYLRRQKHQRQGPPPTDEDNPEGDLEAKTDTISACVRFLLDYEFIRLQHNPATGESLLVSTQLGGACLAASMAPRDGFLLFSELQKARKCFVLETELHAIYLVTPYSVAYQWQNIDWMSYLERWEKLPEAMKRVGELVGIREAFLVKAYRSTGKAAEDHHAMQVHKRFYTALALQELVQEKPLSDVAVDFKCTRGLLQSLQQVAATFAGIVTAFCTSLNWNLLAMIVSQFRERLFFGIQQDLMDLMRIPSLNGQRARMLFNGGIVGVVELANSDVLRVERILLDCLSFQTEQKRDDEDEYEAKKRLSLRNLYVTGRAGLTVQEAARLLVKEARTFVQLETGVSNPDWQEESQEIVEPQDPKEEPAQNAAQVEVTSEVQVRDPEPASENLFSPPLTEPLSEPSTAAAPSFEVSSTDSKQDIECFHNSLIMNFSHVLNDSKVATGSGGKYDQLSIVDVCASADLFRKFQQVLAKSTSIAISFGVSQFTRSRSVIGGNLLVNQKNKSEQDDIERNYRTVMEDGSYLSGVAFTLPQESDSDHPENAVFYLNLRKDSEIKCNLKKDLIRNLLLRVDLTIDIFDAKEQLKLAHKAGLLDPKQEPAVSLRDPKVACWLLQAEDKVIPFQAMVQQYCPEMTAICQLAGRSPGSSGPATNCSSAIDAKIRCTVESFLVHNIVLSQLDHFGQLDRPQDMTATFTSREMPIHVALARMELVGFPADAVRLGALIDRLKAAKDRIAERVRQLNGGRKLDFGSTREVAAALKVPKDRSGRARTSRQVLERIDSPLAALVIAWRKIDSNLSRTIEPLARAIVGGRRIYGSSYCFTSTGRISMHEPNLQTVVKDFKVEIDPGQVELFSCRGTFACEDSSKVLVSADFCQLELCVLTHLSQDRKLLAVMKSGKDVFRGIAAKWNHIEDEREVSDELRNYTKAIVYGVIYGMGARSMAAELNVDEDTARTLMEQFHATYPEIRRYAEKVVQVTRERGYIETLTGRRRYLPAIHSTDSAKRSEAERQAVCTTVQGSAADILKNAILRMARNLRKYRERLALGEVELVLHMHDELIFEAPRDQARKVGKILRSSMENCANLSLPLRVKVKSGPSWGELEEIQV